MAERRIQSAKEEGRYKVDVINNVEKVYKAMKVPQA